MSRTRRLAAILAADVAGWSRLMGEDEEGTLAALQAIRRDLGDPKIEEHHGRIVKTTGDGLLVEFASVVDAVRCACEIQQEMAARNAGSPVGRRIDFRIGIHQGDIIVEDGDIFGDGVNVAARLEALAEPGGICVSARVQEDAAGRLDFGFEDMGEQALKNIARPVHVFQVVFARDAPHPPGARVPPSPRDPRVMPEEGEGRGEGQQPALALPDKPSIAVLPFQNMSGDPEQEYFVDGMVEDIITELSRFRGLFVIARNSTFTYKGKAIEVRQVARELGVRYVLEGSVRKGGDRVRITAQLIEAETGAHLWAERYDRTLEDVFAVQEELTRSIVAAIAPTVESAEERTARRAETPNDAVQLTWRARGLADDAIQRGQPSMMQEAIDAAKRAIVIDAASIPAHHVLVRCLWYSHLYRWGIDPDRALDEAWAAVELMRGVDALDSRTLTVSGIVRVARGEQEQGMAELRRAVEANPNSIGSLRALAYAEVNAGLIDDAKAHALTVIRLNPRDHIWIGAAQLVLAMACYSAHEYTEAVRWAELAIQSQPRAPIRRSIMIACAARAGDLEKAAREREILDSFAPDFIPSLFRGDNRVFSRAEDMEHLLDGLRLAAGEAQTSTRAMDTGSI
jgi:TolB-like protein/class 3 adenylate cyclase